MKIEVIQGDITKEKTDVIVNAANTSLLGGGGVDGAIHRIGGPAILAACKQIRAKQGGCAVGEAVFTTAGNLPAKYVIHTVGPIWQGGQQEEEEKLSLCYKNAMKLAEKLKAISISFPNISTGVYRFPKEQAAEVAIKSVTDSLSTTIKLVRFVCFDAENYNIYQRLLK